MAFIVYLYVGYMYGYIGAHDKLILIRTCNCNSRVQDDRPMTLMTSIPTDLEKMLLAVDDDGGNLLIHEDQDGSEQGGQTGGGDRPHRVDERVNNPASVITCRLNNNNK